MRGFVLTVLVALGLGTSSSPPEKLTLEQKARLVKVPAPGAVAPMPKAARSMSVGASSPSSSGRSSLRMSSRE